MVGFSTASHHPHPARPAWHSEGTGWSPSSSAAALSPTHRFSRGLLSVEGLTLHMQRKKPFSGKPLSSDFITSSVTLHIVRNRWQGKKEVWGSSSHQEIRNKVAPKSGILLCTSASNQGTAPPWSQEKHSQPGKCKAHIPPQPGCTTPVGQGPAEQSWCCSALFGEEGWHCHAHCTPQGQATAYKHTEQWAKMLCPSPAKAEPGQDTQPDVGRHLLHTGT